MFTEATSHERQVFIDSGGKNIFNLKSTYFSASHIKDDVIVKM